MFTTGFLPVPAGSTPIVCPRRQFKKRIMRTGNLSPRQYRKRMNGLRREVGQDIRLRLPKWHEVIQMPKPAPQYGSLVLRIVLGLGLIGLAASLVFALYLLIRGS